MHTLVENKKTFNPWAVAKWAVENPVKTVVAALLAAWAVSGLLWAFGVLVAVTSNLFGVFTLFVSMILFFILLHCAFEFFAGGGRRKMLNCMTWLAITLSIICVAGTIGLGVWFLFWLDENSGLQQMQNYVNDRLSVED